MKGLNVTYLSIIITAVFILGGCCFGNPDFFVSPSRVTNVDSLKLEREKLLKICQSMPGDSCDSKALEIIGHGAGSYRHYAMDFSNNGKPEGNNWYYIKHARAINTINLIEETFSTRYVDAVEIDAQIPPQDHPFCIEQKRKNQGCTFIMHNEPESWDELTAIARPDAYRYMQNNTTHEVVQYFANNSRKDEKRLYLEIKSSLRCMKPTALPLDAEKECLKPGIQVAREIQDIIKNSASIDGKSNWLTVVSFSASALQAFRYELEKSNLHEDVGYGLIAGYDEKGWFGIKECLAQCKGPVPEFSDGMKEFTYKTPWLDRVWFSTKGIVDPGIVFKPIVDKRKSVCKALNGSTCKPLKFSVSTYDVPPSRLKKVLVKSEGGFTLPLSSMMIDIDNHPIN